MARAVQNWQARAGITEADLTAAYQKANTAAVAKAVELGLITQAQADQMNSAGSNAPFGGRHGGWFDQSAIDFNALLADALGISVEELQAAQTQANNARPRPGCDRWYDHPGTGRLDERAQRSLC